MHLDPDFQECSAFVASKGVFHWTVLPMGVKNGPTMFQAMITWILRELPEVMVYIDDVLVGTTKTTRSVSLETQHYKDVSAVMKLFRRKQLVVKASKIDLFKSEIKNLDTS